MLSCKTNSADLEIWHITYYLCACMARLFTIFLILAHMNCAFLGTPGISLEESSSYDQNSSGVAMLSPLAHNPADADAGNDRQNDQDMLELSSVEDDYCHCSYFITSPVIHLNLVNIFPDLAHPQLINSSGKIHTPPPEA